MKEFILNTKTELIHIALVLIASVFLLSSCRTVKKSMEKSSIKVDSVSVVNRELVEVSKSDSTGSTFKIDTSVSSLQHDYEGFRTIETYQASELSPLLMRETIYSRGKESSQFKGGKSEFSESRLSRKDSTVAVEQTKTKVSIKKEEVSEKETKGVPGYLVIIFILLGVANLVMNFVILKRVVFKK